ncbi:hypothetical protein Srufu_046970 [Streptomyces libani subsp. rufus]|nr:hypothetical protein Srufu_046970 [Streptomyces libani subsp. rufus]
MGGEFFAAQGSHVGLQGAAEVAEGAGEVEAVQRVDGEGGGGDVPAGPGPGDVQSAEFGPGLDGGGEDGVAVARGGGVGAEGVGPEFRLLYVPAAGVPAGFVEGDVDGDGEARRVGPVVGGVRGPGVVGGMVTVSFLWAWCR